MIRCYWVDLWNMEASPILLMATSAAKKTESLCKEFESTAFSISQHIMAF